MPIYLPTALELELFSLHLCVVMSIAMSIAMSVVTSVDDPHNPNLVPSASFAVHTCFTLSRRHTAIDVGTCHIHTLAWQNQIAGFVEPKAHRLVTSFVCRWVLLCISPDTSTVLQCCEKYITTIGCRLSAVGLRGRGRRPRTVSRCAACCSDRSGLNPRQTMLHM